MSNTIEKASKYLFEYNFEEAEKSSKKLLVKHLSKDITEDNYDEGEIGNRQTVLDEKIGKVFDSFEDFYQYVNKTWGLGQKNSYGVIDNRIYYNCLEDEDANTIEVSDDLYKKFQNGEINLYSADYDFLVSIIEENDSEEAIKQFTDLDRLE